MIQIPLSLYESHEHVQSKEHRFVSPLGLFGKNVTNTANADLREQSFKQLVS